MDLSASQSAEMHKCRSVEEAGIISTPSSCVSGTAEELPAPSTLSTLLPLLVGPDEERGGSVEANLLHFDGEVQ
jgi:hypothetical protein